MLQSNRTRKQLSALPGNLHNEKHTDIWCPCITLSTSINSLTLNLLLCCFPHSLLLQALILSIHTPKRIVLKILRPFPKLHTINLRHIQAFSLKSYICAGLPSVCSLISTHSSTREMVYSYLYKQQIDINLYSKPKNKISYLLKFHPCTTDGLTGANKHRGKKITTVNQLGPRQLP